MSDNPTPQVDMRDISLLKPAGEPAMLSPDSVSWQVFKNPVAMFIGGITATLLELAEPRIRAGVWDNTEFKDKPLPRLKRTGLAAMVTVFGAESTARRLIHGVNQRHAKIRGTTEDGVRYHASQRELMNWVHTTASFGFLEAYRAFVREVPSADRDRFYSEALNSASVYGAPGCPSSEAECKEHFAAISDQLQATEVNREFLDIMRRTPALPGIMRPFQGLFIRAAVSLLPPPLLTQLELEDMGRLRPWERWLVTLFGKLTDRMVIKNSPAVQSCQRLGLPADYLYQKSRRLGT